MSDNEIGGLLCHHELSIFPPPGTSCAVCQCRSRNYLLVLSCWNGCAPPGPPGFKCSGHVVQRLGFRFFLGRGYPVATRLKLSCSTTQGPSGLLCVCVFFLIPGVLNSSKSVVTPFSLYLPDIHLHSSNHLSEPHYFPYLQDLGVIRSLCMQRQRFLRSVHQRALT